MSERPTSPSDESGVPEISDATDIEPVVTRSSTRSSTHIGSEEGKPDAIVTIENQEKRQSKSAAPGSTEPKPMSNKEIQLVFLAYVFKPYCCLDTVSLPCSLSVAAFLGSLDQTIISTAMPTIASQFNALPQESCTYTYYS